MYIFQEWTLSSRGHPPAYSAQSAWNQYIRTGRILELFAHDYLAYCDRSRHALQVMAIQSIEALRLLLERACDFDLVWIDLNPKTQIGRLWDRNEMTLELDRQINERGHPRDHSSGHLTCP